MGRRPQKNELSILKLLGISVLHLLDREGNKVRFLAPYLVGHSSTGEPETLWFPDLDNAFEGYVDDVSGDCDHNRKLWKTFQEEGRKKDQEVKIWNYIDSHLKKRSGTQLSGTQLIDIDLVRITFHEDEENEFRICKKKTDFNLLVATVYQSCRTLISVISVAAKADQSFTGDDQVVLREYLQQVQKGQYLSFLQQLNMPQIDSTLWNAMRIHGDESNHWGDDVEGYASFYSCEQPWCRAIKLDFNDEFEDASKPGHFGRPTIKEVLSIEPPANCLQEVIKRRIEAELGGTNIQNDEWDVEVRSNVPNYMWFNAIAVADSVAAAIKGYLSIKNGSDSRMKIDEWYSNLGVRCVVSASTDNGSSITVSVRIYEPGLVGKAKQARAGKGMQSIFSPAFIAGADEVHLEYFNDGASQGERITFQKENGVSSDSAATHQTAASTALFTGIWYVIKGTKNTAVDAWVVSPRGAAI